MKVNELKGTELTALLNELFGLKGAKEIFTKHNIEMVTYETEKQGLKQFLAKAQELFENSKVVQEYKQAIMFLDTQINTNKSLLKTSEGFMETMLKGMIDGFETSKKVAVESQSNLFKVELKTLLENIVNEKDIETAEEYISEMTLDRFSEFKEIIRTIDLSINSRYAEDKKDDVKYKAVANAAEAENEKPKKEKKEKIKEEVKQEEKVQETEDDGIIPGVVSLGELAKKEDSSEQVDSPKQEELFEKKDTPEENTDDDFDLGDIDNEFDEPATEKEISKDPIDEDDDFDLSILDDEDEDFESIEKPKKVIEELNDDEDIDIDPFM